MKAPQQKEQKQQSWKSLISTIKPRSPKQAQQLKLQQTQVKVQSNNNNKNLLEFPIASHKINEYSNTNQVGQSLINRYENQQDKKIQSKDIQKKFPYITTNDDFMTDFDTTLPTSLVDSQYDKFAKEQVSQIGQNRSEIDHNTQLPSIVFPQNEKLEVDSHIQSEFIDLNDDQRMIGQKLEQIEIMKNNDQKSIFEAQDFYEGFSENIIIPIHNQVIAQPTKQPQEQKIDQVTQDTNNPADKISMEIETVLLNENLSIKDIEQAKKLQEEIRIFLEQVKVINTKISLEQEDDQS
eukprot:403339423